MKEKPEDTRHIKRLHQNETRSTRSIYKQGTRSPTLCHYWELQIRKWAGSSLPEEPWKGMKSIPSGTIYHTTVTQRYHLPHNCYPAVHLPHNCYPAVPSTTQLLPSGTIYHTTVTQRYHLPTHCYPAVPSTTQLLPSGTIYHRTVGCIKTQNS